MAETVLHVHDYPTDSPSIIKAKEEDEETLASRIVPCFEEDEWDDQLLEQKRRQKNRQKNKEFAIKLFSCENNWLFIYFIWWIFNELFLNIFF